MERPERALEKIMSARIRITSLILRVLLGLLFVVFGLNGFFHFMPMPPMEGAAASFMGALAATGYMFPLIKGTEVVAGALILSGRATPLGLVLLAPVLVNILAFHLVLTPGEAGMSVVLVAMSLGLAWIHRSAWRGLIRGGSAD